MFTMEYATPADAAVWLRFDKHIAKDELLKKIPNKRCYLLKDDDTVVGVMRYNLFWDSIPFLTLIYLDECARGKGYGRLALQKWEEEMRVLGHRLVMTSTQADEDAQHFYRKLGYQDAGCLLLDAPTHRQPTELFLVKEL
ncbi:MAG: GNAT family N-acetyltransferase [Clostridiales bacterium]|nr:GNAT family N-acetyltransferase [Clostridiales bacterium]